MRNRERLAGGPGGGKERPWSPHGGGEIFGTDADAVRTPMLLIRARASRPCPKGMRRKRCGLPHLSARIKPQQPAERTRNRSGTPPTTLASDQTQSGRGLLAYSFVVQPTHETVGHRRYRHRRRCSRNSAPIGSLRLRRWAASCWRSRTSVRSSRSCWGAIQTRGR